MNTGFASHDPDADAVNAAIASRAEDRDENACPVCDGTGETHHPAVDDPECPKCEGTGEA
jgi:DnaJ-class molecular chaperone